jgi:uncharacterized protein YdeI (YjbR/CyaY-like superfamily)
VKATFFASPSLFRAWLEQHHATTKEVWVGFYKRGSHRPSITWPESVDEALCFGWIDGRRESIDDLSYRIRFTPRQPRSTWSKVNLARATELMHLGLMRPTGLKAFEERAGERSGVYSFEQDQPVELDPAREEQFRRNKKAWDFFLTQPAWYRKAATWWVISAKKEETKARRLATLIENSAQGRTVPPLTRPPKRT